MLQVRMIDNKEVKLVFVGNEFQYAMSCSVKSVVMSLPGFSEGDLLLFAAKAIACISEHDEYIVDGLLRVDVFAYNGRLVVNELESLEARHFYTRGELLSICDRKLADYWEMMLYKCISTLL
jgi:hypothetical protein